jgi:hypothetical protein
MTNELDSKQSRQCYVLWLIVSCSFTQNSSTHHPVTRWEMVGLLGWMSNESKQPLAALGIICLTYGLRMSRDATELNWTELNWTGQFSCVARHAGSCDGTELNWTELNWKSLVLDSRELLRPSSSKHPIKLGHDVTKRNVITLQSWSRWVKET